MRIDIINDYPTDLVPIPEVRKCDRCGAYTWWAAPRQKIKGRCWDCVTGISLRGITAEHYERVFNLILETFPGSTVSDCRTRRYAPGGYVGPDAGPCRGCGGRIRIYGSEAYPFCLACRPREE